jgi:hypothetical protein
MTKKKAAPVRKAGHTKLTKGATPKANARGPAKSAKAEKERVEREAAAREKVKAEAAKKRRPRNQSLPGLESPGVVEALSLAGVELFNRVEVMKAATKAVHDQQIKVDAIGEEHGFKPGSVYKDRDRDLTVKFPKATRGKPQVRIGSSGDDEIDESEETPIGTGTMVSIGQVLGQSEKPAPEGESAETHEEEPELVGATH